MKISIICVHNNEQSFESMLNKSLKNQNIEFELIALNNSNKEFSSAAKALNHGAEIASGDILIFSHQDVYIKEVDGIEKLAKAIEKTDVGDIVGVVGVREKSKIYYSNLTDGPQYDERIIESYKENELIEVSSIDEVMFGMKKDTWLEHRFDENLCDNWHLYAVEQSLYARKHGHHVLVCPIQLHHFSHGTITISYMNGLRRLCEAYHDDFKYIWTTCYKVRTNKFYINTLIQIWVFNRKIHGRELGENK